VKYTTRHLSAWLTVAFATPDTAHVIRVNQVGYDVRASKVAVLCSLDSARFTEFNVRNVSGHVMLRARRTHATGPFGPCARTYRLDFSELRVPGEYTIVAGEVRSPVIRIGANIYAGAADTLLAYMREQRSGFNPFFGDSVHKLDGYVIDDSGRVVRFAPVAGGWADAADYLQYVATSATATYQMLMAYRDHAPAFSDRYRDNGLPGANGTLDVLDEARHGLDWLWRMFPNDSEMFNQLGDDRDHLYLDLPTTDSSDYGWGKGKQRPVYPCTARPQGLFQNRNRSTGLASTAGKFASAFALAAQILARKDSTYARQLRQKAEAAYVLGQRRPGVCQTAPARSPYFYEEENWTDDMELAAAELYAITRRRAYLRDAEAYARSEPVTPWMGADTARHYQWYPWHNNGHFQLWRVGGFADQQLAARFYREGLERVVRRATNGFRIGVPFIWCSNDLVVSFATQAHLYRRMTGDTRFREYEQAAIDWLFGTNPWGTSMVIGYPRRGVWPHDPHSVVSMQFGPESLTGGLIDGPVYRSIFQNLRGISLHKGDAFEAFNTGFVVYHDDVGDYSTNEPIMDGTANLIYLLSALSGRR